VEAVSEGHGRGSRFVVTLRAAPAPARGAQAARAGLAGEI
jgi:hypothetical protein